VKISKKYAESVQLSAALIALKEDFQSQSTPLKVSLSSKYRSLKFPGGGNVTIYIMQMMGYRIDDLHLATQIIERLLKSTQAFKASLLSSRELNPQLVIATLTNLLNLKKRY
jgi:hypothetical protein